MKVIYYDSGYVGTGKYYSVPKKYNFTLATCCTNCGQIMCVSWETNLDEESVPLVVRKKIANCPTCDKKVSLKEDVSVISKSKSRPDTVKRLESHIQHSIRRTFRDAVSILIEKVKNDDDMPLDNIHAKLINNDVSLLKQYISNILSVESAVYFLSERLVDLYIAQKQNNHLIAANRANMEKEWKLAAKNAAIEKEQQIKEKIATSKKSISKSKQKIAELKKEISTLNQSFMEKDWTVSVERKDIHCPNKPAEIYVSIPPIPLKPTLKTAGLFNKKSVEAYNSDLTEKYENELESYNAALVASKQATEENKRRYQQYQLELAAYYALKDVEESRIMQEADILKKEAKKTLTQRVMVLNTQIEELNYEISQLSDQIEHMQMEEIAPSEKLELPAENAISSFIRREIKEAEKQLRRVVKIRGQLYSYNVIHSKYRNQVALSSIYEYLDTGRCDCLTGALGAYNIFESECRNNLIIAQLNQVIDTLEEIKKTQRLVYLELKQINDSLDQLNNKMDQVISEMQFLEQGVDKMGGRLAEIYKNTDKLTDSNQNISETLIQINESTNRIQENTAATAYSAAVTAHYTKINVQLTNAVGFMLALK